MATGKIIPCGPCNVDDVTKNAWRWCTSCEEGLCEDREHVHRRSKASRNHKVISIEDYCKIENVTISQVCEQHGENLEWFCKIHDEVLCVACVPSKHKACSDVVPISESSANSRQSASLFDLEETIEGTLNNVTLCIKNRESATKELEKQEMAVKSMVLQTRTKIIVHLDKLQEKLLDELRSTSQTCKSKYMKILRKLKSTEEMLTKLREETKHMKQFSSDIQVFLGTRQINKRITHEVESIRNEIGTAKDYELKVSIESLIEKLSNDVEEFGKIMMSESATNLDFRYQKFDQAHIGINVPTAGNISNIKLKPIKSFQMKNTNKLNVTGCIILPNGNLLMASNTKENELIEYSKTGEHLRNIPVSHTPCNIAVIDLNRIVVTYVNESIVAIMNNKWFNIEKKISLPKGCLGGHVSHIDGRLYVTSMKGIYVIDLSGKQLETLKKGCEGIGCINTNRQKMFYANYNTKQVHCCRLNGEKVWMFQSRSLIFPYDITVDSNHNVYALDYASNSLEIIQHDGRDSKILLTALNGLHCPQCLFYEKDTNALLICNMEGKVALYKVVLNSQIVPH